MTNSIVINKRKKYWTPADEDVLIRLWKKHHPKMKFGKHTEAYSQMSQALKDTGRTFNWREVKDKIYNLKSKYKREMNLIENGEVSDWPVFHKVHEVLGESSQLKEETMVYEETEEGIEIPSSPIPSETGSMTSDASEKPSEDEEGDPIQSEAESIASEASEQKPSQKRKRKSETETDKILKEYQSTNTAIREELDFVRKVDLQMLKIEQERNDILREFMTNAKTFQDNVTNMLKKMK